MPRYTLPVMGLEISFRTDADARRVDKAKQLVERLFTQLNQGGRNLSKEKLLTVLALSLADEYLQCHERLQSVEDKLGALLDKTS